MIPNLVSACTRACMFFEETGIGNGNNQDEEDIPKDFHNIIRIHSYYYFRLPLYCFH
jgi:hypothetical protein